MWDGSERLPWHHRIRIRHVSLFFKRTVSMISDEVVSSFDFLCGYT